MCPGKKIAIWFYKDQEIARRHGVSNGRGVNHEVESLESITSNDLLQWLNRRPWKWGVDIIASREGHI